MKALRLYFYETSLLIFFSSHNSQNQYFLRDASSISTNYFGFDQKRLENFRHHVLAGHVKTAENASQTTKKESLHALVNLVLVEKLVKQVSTETIS